MMARPSLVDNRLVYFVSSPDGNSVIFGGLIIAPKSITGPLYVSLAST